MTAYSSAMKKDNVDPTPRIAANTALFLDIDGTLLDLAPTPDAVEVPAGLTLSLQTLSRALGGALALVSGRALASIDRLFPSLLGAAVGAHGAEVRGSDGAVWRAPAIAQSVRDVFAELAGSLPGLLLEDKGVALSLHYRQVPDALPLIKAALDSRVPLLAEENVQLLFGKAVVDARLMGIDKGRAVAELAARPPFAGRAPLFGGDDTTDMDVLRILPELGGEGFSVGRHLPGAHYVFDSPQSVRRWLAQAAQIGFGA